MRVPSFEIAAAGVAVAAGASTALASWVKGAAAL